jgi:type IV pilus assembly protein PilB
VGKFNLDELFNDISPDDEGRPQEPPIESEGAPGMFVRKDPKETPRPPDFSGGGIGEATQAQAATDEADPNRVRPRDALQEIEGLDDQNAIVPSDDLSNVLVTKGLVTQQQMSQAHKIIKQTPGKRLGDALIEMGVDECQVQESIARTSGLAFERIDANDIESYDQKALNHLGLDYCKEKDLIPLRKEGSRLVIGTTSPDDVFLLDEVKRRLGVALVKHVLVSSRDIQRVIDKLGETETEDYDVEDILADVEEDDVELIKEESPDSDVGDAESSPVVRYVNHIIQSAIKEGASDIHIEPGDKSLRVRFRIDGLLFEMMSPPRKMHASLTSRIKIMANLDIAERRLPQDGRIRITAMGRKLDLRVSTIPTPKGEKTVMRILDGRAVDVGLNELGFDNETLSIWQNQTAQPHGIILVTGPTGSGKTTTLYASLKQLDLTRVNVSMVEDPVEYHINGITQIQTHEKIGMTFAAALRSLLRQDPDVLLVGEIRDHETASIAIQAAMTGHLVLSTLHTNDAPGSVTRLINIGVEPFLVGAALNSVLAQRLVRKLCAECSRSTSPDSEAAEYLKMHGLTISTIMEANGCEKCRQTGYAGRLGLFELLVLDDHTRDAVARNPNVTEFRRICTERGMRTLREDGFKKVADGSTTIEEVLRVTESTI